MLFYLAAPPSLSDTILPRLRKAHTMTNAVFKAFGSLHCLRILFFWINILRYALRISRTLWEAAIQRCMPYIHRVVTHILRLEYLEVLEAV
jgi:hypothetical protein